MNRILVFLLLLFQLPMLNIQCSIFDLQSSGVLAKPITYIWDIDKQKAIRLNPNSQDYKSVIQKAEGILKEKPVAVTDKEKTISGNKHNYESLSIYWWPDPKNPGGPYIARDGENNPEYKQYDYPRLQKLTTNLTTLGKAFFYTDDQRYYDYFCLQLDTWFINPDTRMTPNFEFCQFVPGRNKGRGNHQGIVDAYNFIDMIECVRLVSSVKSIGKARTKALKSWFRDFAYWMQNSDNGKIASTQGKGQVLTYDITLYYLFTFTGQKAARKAIFKAFPQRCVKEKIDDEGKIAEALKRTKAFSYSVSKLRRMVDFVWLAKSDGKRLPRESLDRIQLAFDYITPFVSNRKAFPYPEIGDWDYQVKELERIREKFNKVKDY